MFDKNKFANIIKKINDLYENQVSFAKAAKINRTYLSQYMNLLLDAPPTPKKLTGIAKASKGLTTYNELMEICGYITENANSNFPSLDILLCENIFNTYTNKLEKYDLAKDDLIYLKQILIQRDDTQSSIKTQLNDFAINHSSNGKELFATLIQINDEIENSLINLHKNGNIYPIPVYKNSKNIDLLLPSDIVDYVNFNVPNSELPNNYFALLINDDSMLPLLGTDDIAIIKKTDTYKNGNTCLISLDNEIFLIRKIIEFDDYIELHTAFPYSQPIKITNEEKETRNFRILGKVIRSENQSAW